MEVKTSAKGVSKALQAQSSSKIPIPFKSLKNKKTQRPVINNLVCSTPVNPVKLHIFGTDNQFMSPIRNPSSAATSNNSSPRKALNAEQELETLLNIQKIKMPDKKETNKLSQISRCSQESDYIFQDSIPMQKMIICDSEEENLPKQSKRGRKPSVKTKSKEKNANLSNDKIVTQTSRAIGTKELIQTRSKTEHGLNDDELKNNKTEKKIVNSRTKTKRGPKKRTNESDIEKVEIFIENRNVGTNNDLENRELIQTCSKTETVLNIKTEKKKVSSRTRANRSPNSKKLSPSSQIDNDQTEIEKKNVENKTDIENLRLIHTRSKAEIIINDNKSSKKLKTSARQTINKQTKELLIEDQNKKIKDVDLLRARIDKIKKNLMNGNTKKSMNVRKSENIIYEKSENKTNRSKSSPKNEKKNITTSPNNNAEMFTNLNMKASKSDRNELNKTRSAAEKSKLCENSSAIRKSARKRIHSTKYWINNYQTSTDDENADMVKFKKPSSVPSLKAVKVANSKSQKKSNTDVHSVIDNQSNKEDNHPEEMNLEMDKLETSISQRSFRLVEAALEECSVATVALTEPYVKLEKMQTKTTTKNKELKETTNLPRQSTQSSRRQSFKKPNTNECKVLKAGIIRKSRLLKNAEIEAMQHVVKRKADTDTEYQTKKVKLQTDTNEYSFKKAAILADVSPAKAGGLADVQIDGKRCLLGCFGKFPRHCSTNSRNPDVSVGESIKNAYISTGILEIEPAGRKNYEYAKNVNLLFVVLEGIAQVGIGKSSQVMRIGQDFYVPKDTPYYIENISSDKNVLLYFSKHLF